jgi:hypothetical protein
MAPHNDVQLREPRLALVAMASTGRTIGKMAAENDLLLLLPCLDFLLRYMNAELSTAERLCVALQEGKSGE